MHCKKHWQDVTEDLTENMYNVPSGSGERSIDAHVGSSETGLLQGCLLMYRGKHAKQSDDYHKEMFWEGFSHWCRHRVFPAMKRTQRKSVLILDQLHTILIF